MVYNQNGEAGTFGVYDVLYPIIRRLYLYGPFWSDRLPSYSPWRMASVGVRVHSTWRLIVCGHECNVIL